MACYASAVKNSFNQTWVEYIVSKKPAVKKSFLPLFVPSSVFNSLIIIILVVQADYIKVISNISLQLYARN